MTKINQNLTNAWWRIRHDHSFTGAHYRKIYLFRTLTKPAFTVQNKWRDFFSPALNTDDWLSAKYFHLFDKIKDLTQARSRLAIFLLTLTSVITPSLWIAILSMLEPKPFKKGLLSTKVITIPTLNAPPLTWPKRSLECDAVKTLILVESECSPWSPMFFLAFVYEYRVAVVVEATFSFSGLLFWNTHGYERSHRFLCNITY